MPAPNAAPPPGAISLMAAGSLREALAAQACGDVPTAISALMSIDPESWQAIENRLARLGATAADLLHTMRELRP
ncbi:hypothetical protein IPZ58_21380 [Streptomyces roseoverticillatus]|uniref:hypothetical protein n=1 Tax=Streptomyces roseoverticillatus TaxID=66429 RepID=UPI001F2ADABE|nr:hypothetical protein [Streptomyces roseoverticillatus]MCF3104121.1 hypothetical protein [Streptomyces roseoverticillatus]